MTPSPLAALVRKWRAFAARCPHTERCLSGAFDECADELEPIATDLDATVRRLEERAAHAEAAQEEARQTVKRLTAEVASCLCTSEAREHAADTERQLAAALARASALRTALDRQTERACRFNCDAESSCECPAHRTRSAALQVEAGVPSESPCPTCGSSLWPKERVTHPPDAPPSTPRP